MTSKQLFIILLTVVLAVLLYFAPKMTSGKKQELEENVDFIKTFEAAKKTLNTEQLIVFKKLEEMHKKAESLNDENTWQASGLEFLKAGRYFQDNNKAALYKEAIRSFKKALEINEGNLSAKTNLGTCIVESAALLGNPPMQGISLLREVIAIDSLNIDANQQLGLFSVTSRQFDKAIERFQRILRIDSTHIDMYVYLGDTYLSMGEKQKAIESYENYKIRVKDTLVSKDIDEYIKKLKQNKN